MGTRPAHDRTGPTHCYAVAGAFSGPMTTRNSVHAHEVSLCPLQHRCGKDASFPQTRGTALACRQKAKPLREPKEDRTLPGGPTCCVDRTSPGLVRRLWVGICAPRLRAGRGTRRSPPGLGQLRAQLRAGWTRLQGSRKQAYPCRRQRARAAHGGGFLCSPLGPQAPATPHPRTLTWVSLGHARTPPRPSETENTQKKRELQEANHASWFQSCS